MVKKSLEKWRKQKANNKKVKLISISSTSYVMTKENKADTVSKWICQLLPKPKMYKGFTVCLKTPYKATASTPAA